MALPPLSDRLRAPVLACAALASASCSAPAPESLLGDGCYYLDGKPILRVSGDRAAVLIPGEVREIGIKKQGDHVSIYPGFFLTGDDAEWRAEADRPVQTIQVALGPRSGEPELLIPIAPAGEAGVRRGKPC